MKPSELFTVEMAVAVGVTFVGALVAFGVLSIIYGIKVAERRVAMQGMNDVSRNCHDVRRPWLVSI